MDIDVAQAGPGQQRYLLVSLILAFIGCFIVGAFLGAWAATRVGIAGFVLILTLLAVAWLLAMTAPSKDESLGAARPIYDRETS